MTEPIADPPRYIVNLRFDEDRIGMSLAPDIHIEAVGRPLMGPQDPPFPCQWSVHTFTSDELTIDPPVFYLLDEDSAHRFAAHLNDSGSWPGEAVARQVTKFPTTEPDTTTCEFRLADSAFPDLLPEVHRHLLDWDSLLQAALFHHHCVAGRTA